MNEQANEWAIDECARVDIRTQLERRTRTGSLCGGEILHFWHAVSVVDSRLCAGEIAACVH
jgi:hypothetical protein